MATHADDATYFYSDRYVVLAPESEVWTGGSTPRPVRLRRAPPGPGTTDTPRIAIFTSLPLSDDEVAAALVAHGVPYRRGGGRDPIVFDLPPNPSTALLNALRMSPVLEP